MKSYVKHASAERVRLRHPVFANSYKKQLAFDILQKQAGIAGIKAGPESFLLFLEPEASLERICAALEEKVPEIGESRHEDGKASAPARCPHPWRKTILKTYLVTGVTTVTLAALGYYHWHKFFGWLFTAFAIEHVWVRRRAL